MLRTPLLKLWKSIPQQLTTKINRQINIKFFRFFTRGRYFYNHSIREIKQKSTMKLRKQDRKKEIKLENS